MISNYRESDVIAIREYLLGKGLNEYAVAGVLANMYVESKLRSDNLQNSYETRLGLSDAEYVKSVNNGSYLNFASDRAGFGLCQWTSSGRKAGLYSYVTARNKSIDDLHTQLEYFWYELSTAYKNVLNVLQNAKSVDEATRVVMLKYERPKNQSEENQLARVGYGLEFYKKYAVTDTEVKKKMLKIAIDAGHGYNTPGKRCMKKLDPNQTREWSLNDRIADKLEALLRSYDCEVLRTDDTTGKTDVSLDNRSKKANDWGADIFISIHHNAGILGGSGGGIVVFYYSSNVARATQAKALYNTLVGLTGLRGNRSNGVVKKNYAVLRKTKAPAFLIECGFMDSKTDVPVILSEAHADKTAKALLSFLISTWGLTKLSGVTDNVPIDNSFKVRIAVDSLNYRSGPGTDYAVKGTVVKGGVYTIVETSGSWGKLKSGAGWINISSKYVTRL